MLWLGAAAPCLLVFVLFAEGRTRGHLSRRNLVPIPGEVDLSVFSPYTSAPKDKALQDFEAWASKAGQEAVSQAIVIEKLQLQENHEDEEEQQQQEDVGLADAILRSAALAAEFQKMRVERLLAGEDPQLEAKASECYKSSIFLLDFLSALEPSSVAAALATPTGSSLKEFLRPNFATGVYKPHTHALLARFRQFLLQHNIPQRTGGKGYEINVQQALCIAQTDPEPEAREQAMQALDSVLRNDAFRRQVSGAVRLIFEANQEEEAALGLKGLPTEDNFYGHASVSKAIRAALDSGGCGLYKRLLRLRKRVFIRSKEGLRFGWGDRVALGQPSPAGEGPEFEKAYTVVTSTMSSAAPPLADFLNTLNEQKRLKVVLKEHSPRVTAECVYDPSPVGVQIEGLGFTSPLTGTLLSLCYTPEAGAPGLALFLWRQLMEAKLQELNPLMASFACIPSRSTSSTKNSSSSSKSVLSASNTLLVEAFALWGRHLAFVEEINALLNPQQQLRLLISYLDETLGRIVKGSLRSTFGAKLKEWAQSTASLEALEKVWLRVFKDHFGPEGDVLDTYLGVRSQWMFFDILEEEVGLPESSTAETLGYASPPPKAAHLLAFVALNKVASDCFFIKGYRKAQSGRRPALDVLADAFNTFVAEAERDGLVAALSARGACLDSHKWWNRAIHELVDKPIVEAEMLAQELSYFPTHKVRRATTATGLN